MSPLRRIAVAVAVITATLVTTLSVAPSSAAAASAPPRPSPVTIGGITFPCLPAGIGAPWSSEYSFDDVEFASTDWESGSDAAGWTVDLHITVMHGERLRSGSALNDWFIEYQERPADEVRHLPTRVHGRPGWISRDQIFWLVRPGTAVSVTVDGSRWGIVDLLLTAWTARP